MVSKKPDPLHVLAAFALLYFVPANVPPVHRTGAIAKSAGDAPPLASPPQKAGVKQIVINTFNAFNDDRTLAVSAGATFYGLLALFPAIASFISMFSLFGDFHTISSQIDGLNGFLPDGALEIIREQIARITSKGSATLGTAFAIGFATSLWSANAGMKAMFDALNVAFDVRETRSFVALNASALFFTACFLTLIAVAAALLVVLPPILAYVVGSHSVSTGLAIGRWPALFVVLSLGISLLYRYGPSRRSKPWRWLTPGTIFATLTWCVVSGGFSYYAANFGSYNATYGSLGAAIGLMTWMWLSITVILLGAELDGQIDKGTDFREESTRGARTEGSSV